MKRFLKRLSLSSFACALAACASVDTTEAPAATSTSPWRPIAVASQPHLLKRGAEDADVVKNGALIYKGGIRLISDVKPFGGYSALIISNNGARMLALSDRAHWLEADLHYGAGGELAELSNALISDVTGPSGRVLEGDYADSESLASRGDDIFVGFELHNRIDVYQKAQDGAIVYSNGLADFPDGDIPKNKGIETIALLRGDRILALSEDAPAGEGLIKGWIVDSNGDLQDLAYAKHGAFSPTDAEGLANGDVIVLERAYSAITGVRARLVYVRGDEITQDAVLSGEELALFNMSSDIDNMEGLSVRETADGKIFLYIISDDNQNAVLQKTILLQFELSGDFAP